MPGYFNTLEISGDKFDWMKGIGYTDASTIGFPVGRTPEYTLAVKSHKTGKREFFFYEGRYTLGDDAVEFRYRNQNGWLIVVHDD